jgi:uncharacterized protein YwqG
MIVVEDVGSTKFTDFYIGEVKESSGAVMYENIDTSEKKKYYRLEFWDEHNAQEFVDYVNEIYNVQSSLKQQVFSVWTYAHRIASHAKYSNYFSRVKDKDKNTVVADFDNFVDANELFSAVQALNVQVFKNFMTS